jgi:hypothetical protein
MAALIVAASIWLTVPVSSYAQDGAPQVSTVTLQVVRGQNGSQSVITPKGDLAPLPGIGVAGNVADIYMGSQGGFWYVDANGQTVDLSSAVQALQARRARSTVPVPQYAPQPYYPEQTQTQTQSQSSSNGALAAVGTAAAAGMGAMAGAAIGSSFYNAPYGTPMYYGANGNRYYYNNNNERQTFSDLNQNQQMALYNKRKNTVDQQSENAAKVATGYNASQTAYHNNQTAQAQELQQAQANRGGAMHQENYQRQQQWYQQQVQQNPNRFQKSDNNPFAAQQGARNFADREGGRFGGEREGGRFGGARGLGRRGR